jgi:hypothetical protein
MTDDEDRLLAAIEPLRDLLERMMTRLECLTDRLEVVELEVLHHRPCKIETDRPSAGAPGQS